MSNIPDTRHICVHCERSNRLSSHTPPPARPTTLLAALFGGLLALLLPWSSHAQGLPKWEVGVGMINLHLPYYRGSDASRNYLILYPHLIYRGERVNLDEQGVKSWLFQSNRVQLDFSLAAGLPVPANQNSRRTGMEALEPTVEIGPSLSVHLWRAEKKNRTLRLVLPLRSAFSLDLPNLPHEGWVFSPYLQLSLAHYDRNYWQGAISWGPIFADAQYHNYFYGVEARYASASRPAYHSAGGYAGQRLTFILKRKWENKIISAFIRLDSLNGAVFEDSPLVASKSYHIAGIAVTWMMATSKERAGTRQADPVIYL